MRWYRVEERKGRTGPGSVGGQGWGREKLVAKRVIVEVKSIEAITCICSTAI